MVYKLNLSDKHVLRCSGPKLLNFINLKNPHTRFVAAAAAVITFAEEVMSAPSVFV